MIKFWTLFKHDLYNLISSPGTLSVFLIFPTILILLMGFLFDNLYDIFYCDDGRYCPC